MNINNSLRRSLVATAVALAACSVVLGLLVHLYSFDPYGWAEPGIESVESRDLWNERKDLYVVLLIASFASTIVSGVVTFALWRHHRRRSSRTSRHGAAAAPNERVS